LADTLAKTRAAAPSAEKPSRMNQVLAKLKHTRYSTREPNLSQTFLLPDSLSFHRGVGPSSPRPL